MSTDVLTCPTCMARVFGTWAECKFCGTKLRAETIAGTVHPDELHAPELPGTTSQGNEPASSPWEQGWVNDPEPVAQLPQGGESGDWSTWASGSQATDFGTSAPGDPMSDSEAVVKVEGAPSTWAAGPAPSLDEPAQDNASPTYIDEGPSGLEPVSWYTEPSSVPATPDVAPIEAAPSDSGASGLDPVSWYTEPQNDTASTSVPAPDDGGDSAQADSASVPTSDDDGAERFDPEAIFREPEPDPVSSSAQWDTSTAVETVAPQINWKASANAWDAPVEPKGRPKRQSVLSRESRLLVMGIVVLLVIVIAGRQVLKERTSYPDVWAGNVQAVASWVSSTRDLPFVHPVAVETLPAGDYDATIASAANPENASQALSDEVAAWRAFGAIKGNPKNSLGIVDVQHPQDGAFFDVTNSKLIIRAGTNPQQLSVGVAGALSVALDAQHGDLQALTKPSMSESPLLTVVAGNANAIRHAYLEAKDPSLQDAFASREENSLNAASGFIAASNEMHSRLGRPFVELVDNVQGVRTLNALSAVPPSSSQQIMSPMSFFDGIDPLSGGTPTAPDGTKELESGTLGAQSWYLLAASRLDAPSALNVAGLWAGDNYVSYRKPDGKVCLTDIIRAADVPSATGLFEQLTNWSAKVPGKQVSVKQQGDDLVVVTGCDPGASVSTESLQSLVTPARFLITRSELFSSYYLAGTKIPNGPNGPIFSTKDAACLADQVVHSAYPNDLKSVATTKGSTYRTLTLAAGKTCGATKVNQLFTQADN